MNGIGQHQAAQQYAQVTARLASMSDAEALATLESFVREFPEYGQAQNDVGVLQQQAGNAVQALGRYERAVRLEPDNTVFLKNLAGFYYVELGWDDDAIAIYTRLLQQYPTDTELLGALAIISKDQGLEEQARIFLQRIVELEPWNREAREGLQALTVAPAGGPQQPELDDLLSGLRQAAAPPVAPPVVEAAAAGDQRIVTLERQLADAPTNPLLNNDLGVLYAQAGNLEKALAHHELACRFAPDNLLFLKNYAGICACREDRIDKAIELLTGALVKYPQDTELLAALATICLQVGRPDEALIFLRRILDFEPWNQEARDLVLQLQNAPADFFLTR
ncbi:tetratricopeptide repeat protein [Trichlorobacter sp.]|uniref:tetratricopeptide repeat protein n=1 Tax=Trichlorobacter sp. TaxID=2911007 RepID=UPI002A35FC32|nr:tetratricopeptide repeat protein [Trichlorobacter sp.]MDY0383107.1 tetratricopeptide repeat protein [Trichlorobacter sp.]